MSTYDIDEDHTAHPDWTPPAPRPCGFCEVTNCGCPIAEAELDRLRAQHWDSMGSE